MLHCNPKIVSVVNIRLDFIMRLCQRLVVTAILGVNVRQRLRLQVSRTPQTKMPVPPYAAATTDALQFALPRGNHMRSQACLAAGDGPQVKTHVRSARLERYPNEDVPLVGVKLIERLTENIGNELLFAFWHR